MIDADPVAAAVRAVMAERTEWTGTASDLLGALAEAAGERVAKSKTWPDSPRALSGRLRRAATFLRKVGIEIAFEREGRARTRTIRITDHPKPAEPECVGARPSAPSAPSAPTPKPSPANGFAARDLRTVAGDADAMARRLLPTVRANPLQSDDEDVADGADANDPAQSGAEQMRSPAGRRGYERSESPDCGARRRHRPEGRWRRSGAGCSGTAAGRSARPLFHVTSRASSPCCAPGSTAGRRRTGGPSSTNGPASPSSMAGCRASDAEARAFACCRRRMARSATRALAVQAAASTAARLSIRHDPLLPFGTDPTGHAWLHSRCWPAWHACRRAEAIAALASMGIDERVIHA